MQSRMRITEQDGLKFQYIEVSTLQSRVSITEQDGLKFQYIEVSTLQSRVRFQYGKNLHENLQFLVLFSI